MRARHTRLDFQAVALRSMAESVCLRICEQRPSGRAKCLAPQVLTNQLLVRAAGRAMAKLRAEAEAMSDKESASPEEERRQRLLGAFTEHACVDAPTKRR